MKKVNTTFNSIEDMIKKKQELEGKTKIKFYKNISDYYDNMIIRFDEYPFPKNAQSVSKNYHEVLLLMEFLQTKPQIKKMNNNYYDSYYTVVKKRKEKDFEEEQYENDYIGMKDVIIPNHYIGIKSRER